jgi:hypothetical protein
MPANSANDLPFEAGAWLIERNDPGRPGRFTGRVQRMGRLLMLQLEYGPQDLAFRPADQLELAAVRRSMRQMLEEGRFGQALDLRRLITHEKLKGTLDEVIYSMEAAQIDFLPYQFKPVLKFTQSRTQRLLLADEVGLGKTIESGLIWLEMQARSDAKRLLIVCKKTLCFNWIEELKEKFGIDAVEADLATLANEMRRLERDGRNHRCALVMSYDSMRAAKDEWPYIIGERELEEHDELSPKGVLLRKIHRWQDHFPATPFDLVVFDEAALMKNPVAMRSRTGRLLADASEGALIVTATPLMVHQQDLRTLLRMVDEDFFSNEYLFEHLLESNRPAVKLANALAAIPLNVNEARTQVALLRTSAFVGNSPQLDRLEEELGRIDTTTGAELARHKVRAQALAESLNVLASFMTRTRRVQVQELRIERIPRILTVELTTEERKFYWAVVEHVRRQAALDMRPFHVFQVIGLQMRAASCIPALVEELRSKKIQTDGEFLEESFGSVFEDENEIGEELGFSTEAFRQLLTHDFEKNDRKFGALLEFLNGLPAGEKVVIFAFYRGTLRYLDRRLGAAGYRCSLIHGGIPAEERKNEIFRFRDEAKVRILLSSEVGSEGLNLQFSRVLVNYDLPWNPMKIEQRIGRIDRVGQKADKLAIVHFKLIGTIEERLYERLHQRLELFKNSVGDLEAVLGEEIQRLTVDIVTQPLDEAAMERRIEQCGTVAAKRLEEIEELEKKGESLLAFSDYLQTKIRDDLKNERYVTPLELEFYVKDFFQRHRPGTEVREDVPRPGCLTIRLSSDARSALDDFVGRDTTQRARAVRGEEFSITFRREVPDTLPPSLRRKVPFINHLSPLVQWITLDRGSGSEEFVPCAAVSLESPNRPSGIWVFRIERWKFKGLRQIETLAYAAARLDADEAVYGVEAEAIVREAQREGKSWSYPDYPADLALAYSDALEHILNEQRASAYEDFRNENETTLSIRKQRIESQKTRELSTIGRALETMASRGPQDRMVKLTETRLARTSERFDTKLRELGEIAKADVTFSEVGLGLIRIIGI